MNYTPDHAVRFDDEGQPVETLARAYRPGEVTVSFGTAPCVGRSVRQGPGTWPSNTVREG